MLNGAIKPTAILTKLHLFSSAIRFEHTLFALPFAYIAMFLAADGLPTLSQFIWITVAMGGARTVAMTANRLVHAKEDAANPRTAARHLPRGLLRRKEMVVAMLVSMGVFLFAASQLNTLAFALSPLVVAVLFLYSVPYMLMRTGIFDPSTFSNSSAGPPLLTTRSQISVISRSQVTGAGIRRSSPLLSRKEMNSRRSLYFMPQAHRRKSIPSILKEEGKDEYRRLAAGINLRQKIKDQPLTAGGGVVLEAGRALSTEAVLAVNRTNTPWLKGNCSLRSALSADSFVSLPLEAPTTTATTAAITSLGAASRPTAGTAFRLVGEASGGKEFLLTGSEGEGGTTVRTV